MAQSPGLARMTPPIERFTFPARAAVVEAHARARARGCRRIEPSHLLTALVGVLAAGTIAEHSMTDPPDRGAAVLGITDADLDERFVRELYKASDTGTARRRRFRMRVRTLPMNRQLVLILGDALRASLERGDEHVGTEHLLIALARADGAPAAVLAAHGLTPQRLARFLDMGEAQRPGPTP